MADFSILSTIVCDEVRREVSGKDIIIGVYSGDIVLAPFPDARPSAMALTLWVELSIKEPGHHSFEFRVDYNDVTQFETGGIFGTIQEADGNAVLPLGPFMINVPGPGQIKFMLRMVGKKWRTIRVKTLKLGAEHLVKDHPLRKALEAQAVPQS